MKCPIYIVDSFTEKAFRGNPAAVCFPNEGADSDWMLGVAAEMNLSETAYLKKRGEGFDLRWFTPEVEVDLCGHATLASAHILWEEGLLSENNKAFFYTKSGTLTAEKKSDQIGLNFPSKSEKEINEFGKLQKALDTDFIYAGESGYYYIIEVKSEEDVKNLKPDFGALKNATEFGVIVTAKSLSDEYDFVSRFFAPSVGIDEDPVTGSTHCVLGPYWMKKLNKNTLRAYQASKRGGILNLRVEEAGVYIAGNAVTILKGELLI
jgi:PhzF family phenazine biosynthesis protein